MRPAVFLTSSATRKAGKYCNDLVSPFRRHKRSTCSHCPRLRSKIDSQKRYGLVDSLRASCGLRICDFAADRYAARVLAGILELAWQIFAGSHRGAATGVAANGSWILCFDRAGPAWPDWKNLRSIISPWIGVHIWRVGFCLRFIQLPIYRTTVDCVV